MNDSPVLAAFQTPSAAADCRAESCIKSQLGIPAFSKKLAPQL